jgi:site-specific DNA recombinase
MGTTSPTLRQVTDDSTARVPVAFLGRTSTLQLQDPAASLRRQLRSCTDKLPPGLFIAAHYWDIESGGLDLDQRGRSDSHQHVDTGIPRDGGLADLMTEAAAPAPRFAAVICEDIERSARDTYAALGLEKRLTAAGIPLFAADEPIDVAGMTASTVLLRRMKQGVAEWFRWQLKDKTWKGLVEHSLDGWNIGTAPYGYHAHRVPHPVAAKAAQGRTKSRLILDEDAAPIVAQIFTWRTEQHLGYRAITVRLGNAPGQYPPPPGTTEWTMARVKSILDNPKYTGHMVYGRRRTRAGNRNQAAPLADWYWTPAPVHPAIISRATWDTAQAEGARHATSPDHGPDAPPGRDPSRRVYPLAGRIWHRACQHRMCGVNKASSTKARADGRTYTYYTCPAPARDLDHPRRIAVRQDIVLASVAQFFATRIFGPDRAALLAAQLPATAAADQARHTQAIAQLEQRLHRIDVAEDAHAREIEALTHADAPPAAITALRTRLIHRFTQLEDERAALTRQLDTARTTAPASAGDTALLDELPALGIRLADAPARLQQQLYDAFSLQILYKHDMNQITIYATITDTTPAALTDILSCTDSSSAPVQDLWQPPIATVDRHTPLAPRPVGAE